MKKLCLFFITASLISCTPITENKDAIFVKEYLERLQNSKKYVLKVAALMPEEDYNFKPAKGSLTFAQSLLHIGFAMNWHSKSLLNGQKTKNWQEDTVFKVDQKSKEMMITVIDRTFDDAIAIISKFDTKRLDEQIDYFGLQRSKRQILMLLADHITHHRGQMLVHLRLNGITPPRYVLYQ